MAEKVDADNLITETKGVNSKVFMQGVNPCRNKKCDSNYILYGDITVIVGIRFCFSSSLGVECGLRAFVTAERIETVRSKIFLTNGK